MEDDVEPPANHKLCGYLCAVLSVPDIVPPISHNVSCIIAGEPPNTYFVTPTGVVLTPLDSYIGPLSTPSKRKRWSRFGLVHGSISVIHQLHALLIHKCLRIVARILSISSSESGVRAVILVDVYFPVQLWSGWQFPRSSSLAAALVKHLSYDWEARRSMIKCLKLDIDNNTIWNVTDCHVLGCKHYCSAPDKPKKNRFELQDIFRSLPCVTKKLDRDGSRIKPEDKSSSSGICLLSDDILISILTELSPIDLLRISLTCQHLRYLAAPIMPSMKLKLYPHQDAAVQWMLQRERQSDALQHPLHIDFKTEDGFEFYINTISGEITTGQVPTIKDFHGGMFCDEPGLGKTITALSLILKSQGILAEPPSGDTVIWSIHDGNRKCGYYEANIDSITNAGAPSMKRSVGQKAKRGKLSLDELTPRKSSRFNGSTSSMSLNSVEKIMKPADSCSSKRVKLSSPSCSTPMHYTSRSDILKKNLLDSYADSPCTSAMKKTGESSRSKKVSFDFSSQNVGANKVGFSHPNTGNKSKGVRQGIEYNENWIQCDACSKWRKLTDKVVASTPKVWFCSMNTDSLHRSCDVPEELWDYGDPIKDLRGFRAKGTTGPQEENVAFFINVLKKPNTFINVLKKPNTLRNRETKKALTWLAKLTPEELQEMETIGLRSPVVGTALFDTKAPRHYHKVFEAFGLTKKVEKDGMRWFYPKDLDNLEFDLDSLRVALCEPLDSLKLYLSCATLIVVPSNLVDHWITQIARHVRPGQLRVLVWDEKDKKSAHNLAWDYDVVITTFNRLSAEWGPGKSSVLMQVHWLRVMLDEGHTLGSSLTLTNKMQMAVSLTATNRWLLTGTPTPNTPNSQLSSLQPLLKFLGEEAYGMHQKSWEAGIVKPFEMEMEEGRSRLLQLLHRCMISARKIDLQAIPPCIKKVTFLDFSEEHAKSYNELVETVRRNILMADWCDPSHVESLLNPKQWRFRSDSIKNVRLSCCVAGHVRVLHVAHEVLETMGMLEEKGLDPVSQEYATIRSNILHGGNCMRCKKWCRLPVITPCRHLLCLHCVGLDSEKCVFPGCGHLYEMQSPETNSRTENPNPKWPVPKDLIELQPSYKQDNWNPDWQSTSSTKVTYLVQKLKNLQEGNMIKMHEQSIDNLENLHNEVDIFSTKKPIDQETCNKPRWTQKSPDKVIIFSQFLEHIHVIEQQLKVAGIQFTGMYSPMHSANKIKSLATFQHDDNCLALLMDASASLGLDLSFVNHVYLMEPIWDKSIEEQVISRAHRMGAVRPINVETLAMNGTIEEQMMKFIQEADGGRLVVSEEMDAKDVDGTRSCRTLHDFAERNYLAKLDFVRTNLES